jgi:hypothetical protein
MQSSALGVRDGPSRMRHVTMSSLVAWISTISFTWELAVVAHGAGYAVRSIVTYTIMRRQVKSFLRRRIIMVTAASRSQDSRKKTTVLEGITLTVLSVGEPMSSRESRTQ